MNDNQLHKFYAFLTEKFDGIDRRFDAMDLRLDEAELIQNEILNAIGEEVHGIHQLLASHEKRIVRLERHAT